MLLAGLVASPLAVKAQSGTPSPSPTETARNAAATWAGFGAAQQLFATPGGDLAGSAPGGTVTQDGAVIAPADLNARMAPAPAARAQVRDGIQRSAAPTTAVDAAGHGAVVSGASIR
jgi:hypothetical protein